MDTKTRPVYMLSTRDPLQIQEPIETESEEMEIGIPCKWKSKESWSSNTHIRKKDFKIKTVIRDKEGHYIMIKGSIQEDITIINIYPPNTEAPQYIRQTLTAIKGETDSNTIIVEDVNTPLSSMDRSSRQEINKETLALNVTLDQMDLTDIHRAFHPKAAEYTFFSSAHGTFSRIDHVLGHKARVSKFKNTEIISSIFSDHNAKRLEINYKKKKCKKHKQVEPKQYATKQLMDH